MFVKPLTHFSVSVIPRLFNENILSAWLIWLHDSRLCCLILMDYIRICKFFLPLDVSKVKLYNAIIIFQAREKLHVSPHSRV
jgi:hypothetical protein